MITGKVKEALELPGDSASVNDVLQLLIERYGTPFANTIMDPESSDLKKFVLILVNGQQISSLKGLDTRLKNNDLMVITHPVAGG